MFAFSYLLFALLELASGIPPQNSKHAGGAGAPWVLDQPWRVMWRLNEILTSDAIWQTASLGGSSIRLLFLALRIYRTSTPLKRTAPEVSFGSVPILPIGSLQPYRKIQANAHRQDQVIDLEKEPFNAMADPPTRKWSNFPFKISEDMGGWDSRH